jgi:class 3 adenylate cyclase
VQTGAVVEPGEVRIGDDDRRAVVDQLRDHAAAGRLTLDEFADLTGLVYDARTRAQLDEVVAGLPVELGPAAHPVPAGPAEASPPAVRKMTPRRRFVGIMSGSHARGRWRAPREVSAFAFWGSVRVDLRHAVIDGPVVDISAWAIMGSVDVVVPEGIPVEFDGMVVMGGSTNRTGTAEPLPNAPLVRVHARGLWGSVAAFTRRSKSSHEPFAELEDLEELESHARVAPPQQPPPWPVVPIPPAPMPPSVRWPGAAERHQASAERHRASAVRRANAHLARAGVPVDIGELISAWLDTDRTGSGSRDPDRRDAASVPTGTVTILVTDMVGSTELAEQLGDRRWWDVLQVHNQLVRAEIARHEGTEVKSQGDGFLVVFGSAREAILAGVDVQRSFARYRSEHPEQPVDVRIGLHTGEIVASDGDVFGQNVIAAVRIADVASPGEVLVSGLTHDLTAASGDLRFGPGDEVALKGLSSPWRVHRVEWA